MRRAKGRDLPNWLATRSRISADFGQRLHGIEGIEQPAVVGRTRMELRDASARAAAVGVPKEFD